MLPTRNHGKTSCSPHNPSAYAFLLRSFRNSKSLPHGKSVHCEIIRHGLDPNCNLGNLLFQLYANCGASQDARNLFAKLLQRNVSSWNFLIRAHSRSRESVLQYLEQMLVEGVIPNKFVLIGILSACSAEESLADARRMHLRIMGIGLESEVLVATALLNIYGKCGSIRDACLIFHTMSDRDTVAWNAMITAYVNVGEGKEALQIFEEAVGVGVIPTKATFLSVLEACGSLAALAEGKLVHGHIMGSTLESEIAVRNAVINMYSKCGSLEDARRCFDQMLERNTISWNTMIAAYTQTGESNGPFALFSQMQQEGIRLDNFTFVTMLSTCADQTALLMGKQMHVHIDCSEFGPDVIVCTALVSMYGKCGSVEASRKMFNKMPERDVITWNAMIAAYGQNGSCSDALELFELMQSKVVIPNKATIVSILDACASHVNLVEGRRMHEHIKGSGFELDIIVGTALINMYGKCSCLNDAEKIFIKMFERDIISWNAMIASYLQVGQTSGVIPLFDRMLGEGVLPNRVTYSGLLNACASQSALAVGKQVHARFVDSSFEFDVIVGTDLINMYGKCSSLDAAKEVFNRMHSRDLITWTAMISVYAQHEQGQEALQLFDQMQQEGLIPDIVTFIGILSACTSWETLAVGKQIHARIVRNAFDLDIVIGNALVNMYGKCGSLEDACKSFELMLKHDKVTFVNILSGCTSQATLMEGKRMHSLIVATGLESDVVLGNALVNLYGKCGSLRDAWKLFDQMTQRNVVSWNAIIAAYAQNGNIKTVFQLFDQMKQDEVVPDNATYVSILSACSHAGLVDEGHWLFFAMTQEHGIIPILDHYNCMTDILARAGQLDEAEELLNIMPMQPTAVSWTTLLGACKTEADVKRGERAAKSLLKLAPQEAASHVLLSNIYSTVGRVAVVENMINQA